jgi:regulatory protein YycI of two-component signal transduction system YycFG
MKSMNKKGVLDEYLKEIFILVLIMVSIFLFYMFVTGKVDSIVS